MTSRPRLTVISHVLPIEGISGQQERVRYTLRALAEHFYITFVTAVDRGRELAVKARLSELCDESVVLQSRYTSTTAAHVAHKLCALGYAAATGLKQSNYVTGRLELTPKRLSQYPIVMNADCALFEYWHAADCTTLFRARRIPCVLDMHNVLWRAYEQQLKAQKCVPAWLKRRQLRQYQARETASWQKFDAVVAINAAEREYVASAVSHQPRIFYTPMGLDLQCWRPRQDEGRARLAYYGGLESSRNQQMALRCAKRIMPLVWAKDPEVEFWIVGSNPPEHIKRLAGEDPRIHVTGFVDDVRECLASMRTVLCPFQGTYGFRSRIVQVMAIGVPVIASPDAVDGMELEDGCGIFLETTDEQFARRACQLLEQDELAQRQSRLAVEQVETLYSEQATYGRFAQDLRDFVEMKRTFRNGRRGPAPQLPETSTTQPSLEEL